MRIRLTFHKTEAMRFTGHLDLQRAWERSFRRARLPLAYSQGFTPHPRLNLAAALPLGFTSSHELLDAWLADEVAPEQVQAALLSALPPGIALQEIARVDERMPALQIQTEAAEYMITLLDAVENLTERVQALLAAESLPRQRRDKAYDLRPLVQDVQVVEKNEQGQARLLARLSARESATGRPDEVLSAMGIDSSAARIQRTRIILK
jgi:radical SAM-linked protein